MIVPCGISLATVAIAILLDSTDAGTSTNTSTITIISRLQFHIPQTLAKEGGYDHRDALFGVPHYGESIQQTLFYADSDLCDTNVNTRGGYPIRANGSDGQMEPWPSPYILMVDRGGCTFVTKVRNAQLSGAAGVIIADNTCVCTFKGTCTSEPGVDCQYREPVMTDDGSGSDISIPSFLMFKQDSDLVIAEMKANYMVLVEMSWSLSNRSTRIDYELWTTPTDVASKEFVTHFQHVAIALDSHAYFTPHMYIYDGVKSGCQNDNGENLCHNLCTNNGRYCATDPDNDLDKGTSGADVVKESLRRDCIWKIYGQENGIGTEWWIYINQFVYRCDNSQNFTNDSCIKDCFAFAGIDQAKVEGCVMDSGGLTGNNTNTILELELSDQDDSGVVILPGAFVNSVAIQGSLQADTIFKAICASFVKGSEPHVCEKCAMCTDVFVCVIIGDCYIAPGPVLKIISAVSFFLSIFLYIAIFVALGVWHKKKIKDDMHDQVCGILPENMPLDGGDSEIGSPMDLAQRGASTSLLTQEVVE